MMLNLLSGPMLYLGLIGAAVLWYKNNENKLESLMYENERLRYTASSCEETLNKINEDNIRIVKNEKELNARIQAAESYNTELIQKLRKHNLTSLTIAKPGLIEKRINNATKEIFEEFESVTSD